jgi:hypothetical protein
LGTYSPPAEALYETKHMPENFINMINARSFPANFSFYTFIKNKIVMNISYHLIDTNLKQGHHSDRRIGDSSGNIHSTTHILFYF